MRALIAVVAALFLAMVLLVFDVGRTSSDLPRPAPRLELTSLGGATFSLAKLRGEVVLVNFWATWCPPCVAETPSLVALWKLLGSRGLRIAAVSVDSDEQALRDFVEREGIGYEVLRDPGATSAHRYGTFKYPESFLIDREGRIVRRWIGAVEWNSAPVIAELEAALGSQPP